MDVDSVAAELYGLRPSEFTAARAERAARAREVGDRGLAAAITALRKPTVAAWTAGLLARRRPKEAKALLGLGEALRAAHRALDAAALRKLSHDQHVVIGRLARTARSLAAEAGQTVSDPVFHEVEQILHAVLADADVAAQWAAGRLVKGPDGVQGFTGLEPLPGVAPPPAPAPAPAPAPVAQPAEPEVRRVRTPSPDAQERAHRAHRERVEAARAELAEAAAEVERLEAEQAAARELADSRAAAVAAAEDEVRGARERLEAARVARAEAAAGGREAGRAVTKARARAQKAARDVEKLASSEG